MRKKINRNKFRKIRLAIYLIISIIILVIIAKMLLKKEENIKIEEEKKFTLYDTSLAEYVKSNDDGTKVNVLPNLNQDTKLEGLDIRGIQLTCKNGITTLLADITNNTNEDSETKNINITLLDENNNELRTVRGYIPALKIGETTKLNVAMSSNLITAYKIEFSKK